MTNYECFLNAGVYNHDPIPEGYKKIHVHLVYDAKHDGHHKACLIGDGHITDIPVEHIYSSVVSLHGLRMVTFLPELTRRDLWATDIGNAYLRLTLLRNW
jgi:hypothetical protein